MKFNMRRAAILLLAVVIAGCAGVTPRAHLVQTHQAVHTLLSSVDDAERVLCFGSTTLPPEPTKCNTAVAAAAGLTDARHQRIQAALVKAYEWQLLLGGIISVWQPGMTVDMTMVLEAIGDIQAELDAMNIGLPDLRPLVLKSAEWIAEVNRLKSQFGAK